MLAWNSPDVIPAWLGTNDPADIDFKTKYAEYVLAAIGVTPSDLMPGDAPPGPTDSDKLYATGVYPADNSEAPPFRFPRAGGYSESWQTEQYVDSLAHLLEDADVLGVSIGLFDYQEDGWDGPFHRGLVTGTSQSASGHWKRPAFDAVRDYWYANYR